MNSIADILTKELSNVSKILIVGVGSLLRSDDAIGVYVAKKLKRLIGRSNIVKVLVCEGGVENAIHLIKFYKPSHMIIIDAIYISNEEPGTIYVLNADEIRDEILVSTHHIPIKLLLRYLSTLLNVKAILIGIQVKSLDFNIGMSDEVKAAGKYLLKLLVNVLRSKNLI